MDFGYLEFAMEAPTRYLPTVISAAVGKLTVSKNTGTARRAGGVEPAPATCFAGSTNGLASEDRRHTAYFVLYRGRSESSRPVTGRPPKVGVSPHEGMLCEASDKGCDDCGYAAVCGGATAGLGWPVAHRRGFRTHPGRAGDRAPTTAPRGACPAPSTARCVRRPRCAARSITTGSSPMARSRSAWPRTSDGSTPTSNTSAPTRRSSTGSAAAPGWPPCGSKTRPTTRAPPEPEDLSFVLIGNGGRDYGGVNGWFWGGNLLETPPTDTQYEIVDIAREYDPPIADFPTNPFNLLALANGIAAFSYVHLRYDEVNLDDPDNIVWKEGKTTYVHVPTDHLPLLQASTTWAWGGGWSRTSSPS